MAGFEKFLFVLDSNARPPYPKRTHQVPNGDGTFKDYTFEYGAEPVRMPAQHAAYFLRDEAFIVTNQHGVRQIPVPKQKQPGQVPVLQPGECVARYEELTKDALMRRASVLPGGQDIKASMTRDVLIAFLIQGGGDIADPSKPKQSTPQPDAGVDDEDDLIDDEEMSEEEQAAIFDGAD